MYTHVSTSLLASYTMYIRRIIKKLGTKMDGSRTEAWTHVPATLKDEYLHTQSPVCHVWIVRCLLLFGVRMHTH